MFFQVFILGPIIFITTVGPDSNISLIFLPSILAVIGFFMIMFSTIYLTKKLVKVVSYLSDLNMKKYRQNGI